MGASTSGGQLILEGDGLGWSGGKRPIAVPSGDWDGVIVAFRAWWDSYTASNQDVSTPGWDPMACLGMGFADSFPAIGGASGFFGIRGATGASATLNGSIFISNVLGASQAGAMLLSNGTAGIFNSGTSLGTVVDLNASYLPANPMVGAQYTSVWIIKRSLASDTVLVSIGRNLESLPRDQMLNARISGTTIWDKLNVSVTDSTYWRSGGGMSFPTQFFAKNPSPTSGRKLVVDHVAFQFFKFNELD